MDKTKLEEKLTRVASEIFRIPAQNRTGSAEFLSLRTKLAECLWNWARLTFDEEKVRNSGTEIMDCVNRSLESFNGPSADYIKYISASLKKEITRANERKIVFNERAISLPEKKRRLLKSMIRSAKEYGKDIQNKECQEHLARMYGHTEKEIADLVKWYFQSSVQSETTVNDEGEEISLLDTKRVFENSGGRTPAQELEQKDEISFVLTSIDKAFSEQQDRTKPYLSALLTRQLLEELEQAGIDRGTAQDNLAGRAFAMTDEALKVKEAFLSGESCPAQQELDAWFGKDKTDASRTMRNFLDKLKRREEAVDSLKT
ncbi:MAG: hypothetical protein IJL80_15350 [Treponema sp.]|nr:hypothetical protein [Treponema sp.]